MRSFITCTLPEVEFKVKENQMSRVRSAHGERRNAYTNLVGKPEGKRPLGRPRRMWDDNIKMDLGELGWGGWGWVDLAQDRDH
jgi:hypothetical protein